MPNRAPLDAVTARWLPWVVAIAFFMQSLDGTILNTALPAMASDLAENPLRMQGVIIAYMLTVALLIPASGWIADRYGTKKIFFGAILLRSEEPTSELQSLMRISYAVFCLKKQQQTHQTIKL